MTAVDADPAAGFLAAVLADPADDAPRMAYADWLTERGDPRGEFVAVQLQLGRTPDAGEFPAQLKRAERERWSALKGRERGLLAHRSVAEWMPSCLRRFSVAFRRGFVAHVTLSLADFEAHAAALFAAAPVESVRLADREPVEAYGRGGRRLVGYGWRLESWDDRARYPGTHVCPAFLESDLLNQDGGDLWAAAGALVYPSADTAHAALSAACVAFGRDAAGLDPLPMKAVARA